MSQNRKKAEINWGIVCKQLSGCGGWNMNGSCCGGRPRAVLLLWRGGWTTLRERSKESTESGSSCVCTSYMDIFVGSSKRIRNLNLGKLARSKHFLSFRNCRNSTDLIPWQQTNSCEWWSYLHQVFPNKTISNDVSSKVTCISLKTYEIPIFFN